MLRKEPYEAKATMEATPSAEPDGAGKDVAKEVHAQNDVHVQERFHDLGVAAVGGHVGLRWRRPGGGT